MGKAKAASSSNSSRKMRPALTPEARENQMISLAVDLAEKQLMEGTASSQVITHYLKLGSTRERLEREKIEGETELYGPRSEELYENALKAFRRYSGEEDSDEEDL